MTISLALLLKKSLSVMLLPPLLPILLIAAGMLLQCWRPRAGRWLALLGLALTVFFTMPMTVNLIVRPLERVPLLTEAGLQQAQAIVILAGGQRVNMPEYGGATPNRLTLERLRYGARLARQSGLPVLISGGNPTGRRSEARSMEEVLRIDFGVEVRWMEEQSMDTADNARFSAPLLRADKIERIALVTHAAHMRRARNEFEAQGFKVITAPTAFQTNAESGEEFFDFLPSMTSAYAGWYATHEWLGLAAQKLRFMWPPSKS